MCYLISLNCTDFTGLVPLSRRTEGQHQVCLALTVAVRSRWGKPEGPGTFSAYRHMVFLGAFPWCMAAAVSCTLPLHLWVPLLLPTLLDESLTSLVLRDTGHVFGGGWGRLEMQRAEWQAGFVQFYSVLLVVEMGEKMNVPVKNPPSNLTGSAWLIPSHITQKLCWRLTGERCIKCSAEPEQWN